MLVRRLGLVAVLTAAGCFGVEDDAASRRGVAPPEASLRAPVIAPLGLAITLDASSSSSRGGQLRTYVFDFGDGSDLVRSAEPTTQHAFTREGLYSVRVHVLDASGLEGLAAQDVAVRADFPEHPELCRSAADCVVGDECDAGACYTTGGALQ